MTERTDDRQASGAGTPAATARRDELALRDGHRLALVTRRDGSYDLLVEGRSDGVAVRLDEDEADVVARALGSSEVMSRLAKLQHDADGLRVEQLPVPPYSPYADRPLGDTRMRSRTGASVVAVLREAGAQPAPKPDFVLKGGDLVVAVGTRDGLDQVGRILEGTG